jgi:hypothetical protein
MSHLWVQQNDSWAILPLELGRDYSISSSGEICAAGKDRETACLLAAHDQTGDGWVLLAPPGAANINGREILGISILRHRDHLQIASRQLLFSTERLAKVEPFTGAADVCCGRCTRQIAPKSPSVRCPKCGIFHHGSAEDPCWEYAPQCSVCDCKTDLRAGFSFTPESHS